jgi:transcriptional regulator NrdR family protein
LHQLKVIKRDNSTEEYMHTKVFGTLNNAMGLVEDANVFAAEQFAEAITFYFYRNYEQATVSSDQIHLMIQTGLRATGYEHAAEALRDYHLQRNIKRSRVEVVKADEAGGLPILSHWNKTHIVNELVNEENVDRKTARAIASAAEEKVLKLGMGKVTTSLIAELVASDKASMLRARETLNTAVG